jgi:hypothetical protein
MLTFSVFAENANTTGPSSPDSTCFFARRMTKVM